MIPGQIERVALLGWRVAPASSRSRATLIRNAAEAASCDLDVIGEWAARWRGCRWVVVMAGSGIWGLDIDAPGVTHGADGIAAMRALTQQHGALPPRPMTRSGGGGYAMFFRDTGHPIRGQTGWPAPGIDPRRGRLTVTIPPSRHLTTDSAYRWITPPWEVAPPPAPQWLLDLMAPPPPPVAIATSASPGTPLRAWRAIERSAARVADAPAGRRNSALNNAAFVAGRLMAGWPIPAADVESMLARAAQIAGLPTQEIVATIRSGVRAGLQAGQFPHA